MEAVSRWGLLSSPPPLHLLNDLRHHTDGGGEADQKQQVCTTGTQNTSRKHKNTTTEGKSFSGRVEKCIPSSLSLYDEKL